MPTYRYGGKQGPVHELLLSDDFMVVRTQSRKSLFGTQPYETAPISHHSRNLLTQFELVNQFQTAGVEVLRAKSAQGGLAARDQTRAALKSENEVQFAGRGLIEPTSHSPVLYTENLFVKFQGRASAQRCETVMAEYGLRVKRSLDFSRNAYFVSAPDDTGLAIFELAERLLNETTVEFCHPELVRENRQRQLSLPKAFPQQWHLEPTTINGTRIDASANVAAAWALSQGEGRVIAVIDDGFDLEHEEFRSVGKVVFPRDSTRNTNNPRPGRQDNHGTACAGVACADGSAGATGVAPRATLMPIRLASGLGSIAEAEAFAWAVRNGADVISCSWGPPDGVWFDPNDPGHNRVVPLPDSTRLAIEFAVTQGRGGKGCVICFAAGNGNESVENDGYASFEKVIAVAACNDLGTRSAYSDMGESVWCAFPSNNGDPSQTEGIWTTDRAGNSGYNWGSDRLGDPIGNYTNSFGGTSSACPGVAGVAALILARNPDLGWEQVREVLKQSCDRIDEANGQYDENGHSPWYGYGRVNALKAVELATPSQPNPLVVYQAIQDVPIQDLRTASLSVTVPETKLIQAIKLTVNLEHTYIGDLIVTLKSPAALGIAPIQLHNREGGSMDNLQKTYDAAMVPALAQFAGKSAQGVWSLEVRDSARWDTGVLRSFAIELAL
ncbi:MAG: S8 family serine peptidase [Synechococcales cyanobacterium CRU_2_2]|nr:S8 family serine peptidase [Synechococcales cyanobacterium CRU_2_2]